MRLSASTSNVIAQAQRAPFGQGMGLLIMTGTRSLRPITFSLGRYPIRIVDPEALIDQDRNCRKGSGNGLLMAGVIEFLIVDGNQAALLPTQGERAGENIGFHG